MNRYVIFDLDGTIANLDHRLHFLKDSAPQDWEGFFQACDGDILNEWALSLAYALDMDGYQIVIVSGRPERTREKTKAWLDKHAFPYFELVLVRKDGDHAPDELLKENWLKQFTGREEILFVVDDRQKVVDMWRENGLVCLQCYSWAELASPYPKDPA